MGSFYKEHFLNILSPYSEIKTYRGNYGVFCIQPVPTMTRKERLNGLMTIQEKPYRVSRHRLKKTDKSRSKLCAENSFLKYTSFKKNAFKGHPKFPNRQELVIKSKLIKNMARLPPHHSLELSTSLLRVELMISYPAE